MTSSGVFKVYKDDTQSGFGRR